MANLNRVLLIGNLTRDPELRYLPSNTPVVSVGLAVNRRWKNQQGEQQEETVFIDCEGFGRTAEVINQYLKKGNPAFIEGRLKLDQWTDKEGHNRQKMKVVIEGFQFLSGREGGSTAGDSPASTGAPQPRTQGARPPGAPTAGAAPGAPASTTSAPSGGGGEPAHQTIQEEDIPF